MAATFQAGGGKLYLLKKRLRIEASAQLVISLPYCACNIGRLRRGNQKENGSSVDELSFWMQRLHCWLDQLTLRRGRNRDANVSRRITSQSLTPSYRVALESKNKHKLKPTKTSSQASPSSRNSQEPRNAMLSVPNLVVSAPLMARKPETGSFARRRGIQTNPWLYGGDSLLRNSAYHHTESLPPQAQCLERRCAPPTLLGVKSLEESTCSSGYGSQDCSPDSSIHMPSWQTTDCSNAFIDEPFDEGSLLEETSSFSTYDNICDASDEHIYHELESCFRVVEESCSSTPLSSLGDSRSDSPLCGRPESPVYAQPWTHYHVEREHYRPNMLVLAKRSSSTKALTVRNQSFRRVLPEIRYNEYARPFHGRPLMNCLGRTNSFAYPEPSSSWVHRTENYRQMNENNRLVENHAMEDAEEEFLSELDAQIAELQLRSDELRSIVEKACQRRHATSWLRPSMECTFELSI